MGSRVGALKLGRRSGGEGGHRLVFTGAASRGEASRAVRGYVDRPPGNGAFERVGFVLRASSGGPAWRLTGTGPLAVVGLWTFVDAGEAESTG